MKAVSILMVTIAFLAVMDSGWGEIVVNESQIVERDGLWYEIHSEVLFTGKVVSYWSTGQKKAAIDFRDGHRHGKMTMWYQNGQKQAEGEIRDGHRHGKMTMWYQNGQKQAESEFRDNKLHGKTIIWYKTGQKKVEAEFRDNKHYGKGFAWYKSGQKWSEWEGEATNQKCWDENGNPVNCDELAKAIKANFN